VTNLDLRQPPSKQAGNSCGAVCEGIASRGGKPPHEFCITTNPVNLRVRIMRIFVSLLLVAVTADAATSIIGGSQLLELGCSLAEALARTS
jgi:hypothetical protein